MTDNDTPNRAANKEKGQDDEGEDIVNGHQRGHDTPRRYDEPLPEGNSSTDDPALKTQI